MNEDAHCGCLIFHGLLESQPVWRQTYPTVEAGIQVPCLLLMTFQLILAQQPLNNDTKLFFSLSVLQ